MYFPLIKLRRQTGDSYEGERPKTVRELVEIDRQGNLEPMVLHEWLWDSLQNKTDTIENLESLTRPFKEYVSVWSVRIYISNGGITAPLFSVPLTLPYAKDGYLAINRPVAAQAVDRMISAVEYVLAISNTTIEKSDLSTLLYDLADESHEKIAEILEPG